jgi:hypothetical protein
MLGMRRLAAALLLAAACAGQPSSDEADLDTGVGDVVGSAQWGAATTCKGLPTGLPQLAKPAVVVSLDGLTLHLWDQSGTFDRVYPIGPGAIENGVSLTPVGHFTTGPAQPGPGASDDPKVVGGSTWAWWYRCKIWWTDPATQKIQPVYAGLPLIRLKGPPTLAYALHGPVDNFGSPSGGSLRRAYVSHGCLRLRPEDISEIYLLLHGHSYVPVTVQRAVERDDQSRAVDLAQRWVGSECTNNSDCNFPGGVCQGNAYGRGFCTASCSRSCADRAGEIATACVPDGNGSGMCVRQASLLNNFCRPYESFEYKPSAPRFGSARAVDACEPGSAGFVGDPCLSSADCSAGRSCERHGQGPGLCTQACDAAHACPTQNGLASACVAGRCLRRCDVQDACGGAVAAICSNSAGVLACIPSGA